MDDSSWSCKIDVVLEVRTDIVVNTGSDQFRSPGHMHRAHVNSNSTAAGRCSKRALKARCIRTGT